MPQSSKIFSVLEYTSRADENRTRANECRNNPNTAKWLDESARAALFQFSNKSAIERNFETNYVRKPLLSLLLLLFARFSLLL